MQKLSIAIICDPVTLFTAGSILSPLRFADNLVKRGHNVVFIASKDKSGQDVSYRGNVKIYHFSSVLLPKSNGQYRLAIPSSKKLRKIFIDEKINIVYATEPTLLAVYSFKVASALGIKKVVHCHVQPESLVLHLSEFLQRPFFQRIYAVMYKYIYKYLIWVYRKADIVLGPSELTKRMLHARDSALNITIISNGVDHSKFKKVKCDSFVRKYSLSEDNKIILFVGRLNSDKKAETLISAMPAVLKEYPAVHLVIVGTGYQRSLLESLVDSLSLKENVSFLGKIPENELVMAYSACDIFVLPSVTELEGMVVLEAMSCGKPIIISDSKLSASSDFVDGNGFVFKLKDSKDLAEKALLLLKDDVLRKRMGSVSYKNSLAYDIQKSIDKLESVFYSLLNK